MERFLRLNAEGAAAVHRHGANQAVKHGIAMANEWIDLSLTAESVSERISGILHELDLRADESASGDTRENSAVRTRLEAGAKAAADDAFLHPDFAWA
jgi:hypothetical protein